MDDDWLRWWLQKGSYSTVDYIWNKISLFYTVRATEATGAATLRSELYAICYYFAVYHAAILNMNVIKFLIKLLKKKENPK